MVSSKKRSVRVAGKNECLSEGVRERLTKHVVQEEAVVHHAMTLMQYPLRDCWRSTERRAHRFQLSPLVKIGDTDFVTQRFEPRITARALHL